MRNPKYVLSKGKNGQFYFKLNAGNGEPILASEGYTTKPAAKKGIASVQKNATDNNRFEKKVAKNGKFYFNLKARNGQIIGTSEMYESEASRDNGIKSVMKNGPKSDTEDVSAQ